MNYFIKSLKRSCRQCTFLFLISSWKVEKVLEGKIEHCKVDFVPINTKWFPEFFILRQHFIFNSTLCFLVVSKLLFENVSKSFINNVLKVVQIFNHRTLSYSIFLNILFEETLCLTFDQLTLIHREVKSHIFCFPNMAKMNGEVLKRALMLQKPQCSDPVFDYRYHFSSARQHHVGKITQVQIQLNYELQKYLELQPLPVQRQLLYYVSWIKSKKIIFCQKFRNWSNLKQCTFKVVSFLLWPNIENLKISSKDCLERNCSIMPFLIFVVKIQGGKIQICSKQRGCSIDRCCYHG